MNAKLISRRAIFTFWLMLAGTFIFRSLADGQTTDQSKLTSESAMELLNQDVGRWSGTRETYSNNIDPAKTTVTMVNRMEANSWLYFQIAEGDGDQTQMSKGTLAFNPETGKFTRRWFENGNPEIKGSEVSYDAGAKKLTFSVDIPAAEPNEGGAGGNAPQGDVAMTYTAEIEILDADTRVVRVFSQPTGNEDAGRTLESALVLTRAKSVASSNGSAGSSSSNSRRKNSNDDPAGTKDAADKSTEPVTHVLLVRVRVASNALREGQDPELEIEPPDATGKRISDDTFEFKGLKSGVEYTVNGKYKLETGFKIETSGKTSYEFAKDAKTKITKTKILKLEGN